MDFTSDLPAEALSPVFSFIQDTGEQTSREMQKEAQRKHFSEKYNASPEVFPWVEKIAHEIATLAIQSRLHVVEDRDFHGLLKEAGIEVGKGSSFIEEAAERILIKRAFSLRLEPLEEVLEGSPPFRQWIGSSLESQEKIASTADKLVRFMSGVRESVSNAAGRGQQLLNDPSLFGSVGKWTALGVPVAGAAGYIKGKSAGKEAGEQEMADALANRLSQLRQQYGEE